MHPMETCSLLKAQKNKNIFTLAQHAGQKIEILVSEDMHHTRFIKHADVRWKTENICGRFI